MATIPAHQNIEDVVPLNRRHDARNARFPRDAEMADALPERHAEDSVVKDGRRDKREGENWRRRLGEADCDAWRSRCA